MNHYKEKKLLQIPLTTPIRRAEFILQVELVFLIVLQLPRGQHLFIRERP